MDIEKVFLCGFMGSGKTTIGKVLAKRLGVNFLDTDKIIEDMQGISIKEIFERYSENYFRLMEIKVIKDFCRKKQGVISLGGGSLDLSKNIREIKGSGQLIFLDANFNTIKNRLKNDTTRPLLNKEFFELQRLYQKRKKIFLKNADLVINANGSPFEVCNQIVNNLK